MKWIIIAIVVLIIGGGAAFYIVNNSDDSETQSTQTEGTTEEQAQDTTEITNIKNLLARNENITCSYDYTDESGNNNVGKAYFSNGNMYGEFTVKQADGTELNSKVLSIENTQYVWDQTKKEGYKVDLSVISDTDVEQNENEAQSVDQNAEYEFKCTAWNVDKSKFEIPSDVNFIDNTAIIQNVQENIQDLDAVCDSLEGEAKAACERATSAQ